MSSHALRVTDVANWLRRHCNEGVSVSSFFYPAAQVWLMYAFCIILPRYTARTSAEKEKKVKDKGIKRYALQFCNENEEKRLKRLKNISMNSIAEAHNIFTCVCVIKSQGKEYVHVDVQRRVWGEGVERQVYLLMKYAGTCPT